MPLAAVGQPQHALLLATHGGRSRTDTAMQDAMHEQGKASGEEANCDHTSRAHIPFSAFPGDEKCPFTLIVRTCVSKDSHRLFLLPQQATAILRAWPK